MPCRLVEIRPQFGKVADKFQQFLGIDAVNPRDEFDILRPGQFGMDAPDSLEWSSKKKEGLSRPFGEPEAAPLSGKQASITKDRATHAKSIAAVSEAEFEQEMQATFPHRDALPSSNSGA